MPMSDYCDECIGKGVCPLCGIGYRGDRFFKCDACGWKIDDGPQRPQLPEMCDCHIKSLAEEDKVAGDERDELFYAEEADYLEAEAREQIHQA